MILNQQKKIPISLPALNLFLKRIQQALHLENVDIFIAFVTDAAIAKWNAEYRGKKGPTDVLSFPAATQLHHKKGFRPSRSAAAPKIRAAPQLPPAKKFLGDIAIAPATALHYATKNHRTLAAEVRVLMLHGVLHLMGYDHERDRGEMDRLERRLRRRLGIA